MSLTLTRRHNADRFGYLIPTKYGNVPMVGAVATYRPGEGRFGRGAVAVEEGTENLAEPLTMSEWSSDNVTLTPTDVKYEFLVTAKSDVSPSGAFTWKPGISPGVYSVSCLIKGVGSTVGKQVKWRSGNNIVVGTPVTLSHQYQKLSAVITLKTTGAVGPYIPEGFFAGESLLLKNMQLEQKPFATSFVDGSRPDGQLPIFTDAEFRSIFEGKSWTISGYFKRNKEDTGTDDYRLFSCTESSGFNIESLLPTIPLRFAAYDKDIGYKYIYFSDPYLFNDLEYHHIAVCYDSESKIAKLFVDGQLDGTATFSNGIYFSNKYQYTLCVGTEWTPTASGNKRYNASPLNGLVDELLILPYAASEEEIVSWYEAQGPLPPHPQAVLQWDWQAVRPAQMVKL